ncbi:MAG: exodeoxyribonuclease VII large subunit [Acidimicrobiales bacterium]
MTLFSDPPPAIRQMSLVKLSAEIARSLASIGRIAVEGEIHNPKRRPNGRVFLTLKDRAAQIGVVVSPARAKRARIVGGERVRIVGKLEWNNQWGSLQLNAEEVAPVGEGAIAAAIADARDRMRADGLLDRPRRPVPRLPRAVGVICGSDAAVRHDIESVKEARFPGYPLLFREVTVSGPGAADAITWALRDLAADPEVEVIILARGGGDATQLLPFSDEDLCRAICDVDAVVVAAVGHENDRPLCDEVVDLRCGTPSMAAAAVVPEERLLRGTLDELYRAGARSALDRLDRAERQLVALDRAGAVRAGYDRALATHGQVGMRLRDLHPRRLVGSALASLGSRRRELEALNPRLVLARGYAVAWDTTGRAVRDPAEARVGDLLQIEVAGGRFPTRVEEA